MMVKAESRKRAEELCRAALKQDESRRAEFVEQACAGDEALLQEAKSLLAEAQAAPPRPEAPAAESATQQVPLPGAGAVGQRLSHYEIVSRIGSGGMGEVYRAKDLSLGRDVGARRPGASPSPARVPPQARGLQPLSVDQPEHGRR